MKAWLTKSSCRDPQAGGGTHRKCPESSEDLKDCSQWHTSSHEATPSQTVPPTGGQVLTPFSLPQPYSFYLSPWTKSKREIKWQEASGNAAKSKTIISTRCSSKYYSVRTFFLVVDRPVNDQQSQMAWNWAVTTTCYRVSKMCVSSVVYLQLWWF